MAADKQKNPAKRGRAKSNIRGRLPSKTTINLVLIDENKINPWKAAIGIVIIIILATLFGKFLVADRLMAMSTSAAKAAKLKADLQTATEAMKNFGDVESTYAHYTYAGMTQSEKDLVDRAEILGLINDMLPVTASPESFQRFGTHLATLFNTYIRGRGLVMKLDTLNQRVLALLWEMFPPRYTITAWSVSGNVMTLEATGNTLRTLNHLARSAEKKAIVDSCSILTAKKDKLLEYGGVVEAKLVVYLQKASEAESKEASAS